MQATTTIGYGPCGALGPPNWTFSASGNNNFVNFLRYFGGCEFAAVEGCLTGGHVTGESVAWVMIPYKPEHLKGYEERGYTRREALEELRETLQELHV
jgi:hypothetical protein